MAYDLYNENGYAGPGPCINGLRVLKKEVSGLNTTRYPQLASFFQYGFAASPMRLKQEVMEASKLVNDKGAKTTLLEIGKAAAKSSVIVILHDHMSV